jgi:hypothetical protein
MRCLHSKRTFKSLFAPSEGSWDFGLKFFKVLTPFDLSALWLIGEFDYQILIWFELSPFEGCLLDCLLDFDIDDLSYLIADRRRTVSFFQSYIWWWNLFLEVYWLWIYMTWKIKIFFASKTQTDVLLLDFCFFGIFGVLPYELLLIFCEQGQFSLFLLALLKSKEEVLWFPYFGYSRCFYLFASAGGGEWIFGPNDWHLFTKRDNSKLELLP